MLLADLGADVVKVEPPRGDEWRRYDPFADGESRYFYALNRGKRSVALDLKTPEGRERSRELIASADALVHNCLPDRARAFGLDRESVRRREPALRDRVRLGVRKRRSGLEPARLRPDRPGAVGPPARRPAARRRRPAAPGGLALADFTAGLLAALAVTAGLLGRDDGRGAGGLRCWARRSPLQAQRFVRRPSTGDENGTPFAGRAELERRGPRAVETLEALDPYYRAHACADGFVALACLNTAQRLRVCELLGLEDAVRGQPAGAARERRGARRAGALTCSAVEDGFARLDGARGGGRARRTRRARRRGARASSHLSTTRRCAPTGSSRRSSSRASAPCACSAARSSRRRRGRRAAARPRRSASTPPSCSERRSAR